MELKTKLTVGILSYNRPKELLRSVQSLLPLPADVEVLICDDKSPKLDEIQNAIVDLISIPNIKFISNENNLGYDRNLFQTIELASSDFVMLLGDDDYLESGTLQNVLHHLNPDFHCGFVRFKEVTAKTNTEKYFRHYPTNKYFDSKTLERDGSFLFNSILFSGLIFSKKSIELNKIDFSSYYKSIYIQVAIFTKLNLLFGSHYINGPGVILGGDGENGFGFNNASGDDDSDLRNRTSIISNLSYHKRLITVLKCLQNETGKDLYTPFSREYKIRSIKAFYLARKHGRKYTLNYWKELRKIKIKNLYFLYPIYSILILLPTLFLDYPIAMIEKYLNYYRNKD